MSDLKNVRSLWEDYRTKCVPGNASVVQLTETKRAFYAGVTALLTELWKVGDDSVSMMLGEQYLEACLNECIEFAELDRRWEQGGKRI